MGIVKRHEMDKAEKLVSNTLSKLKDGEINNSDIENIFIENKDLLELIGINDLIDFEKAVNE